MIHANGFNSSDCVTEITQPTSDPTGFYEKFAMFRIVNVHDLDFGLRFVVSLYDVLNTPMAILVFQFGVSATQSTNVEVFVSGSILTSGCCSVQNDEVTRQNFLILECDQNHKTVSGMDQIGDASRCSSVELILYIFSVSGEHIILLNPMPGFCVKPSTIVDWMVLEISILIRNPVALILESRFKIKRSENAFVIDLFRTVLTFGVFRISSAVVHKLDKAGLEWRLLLNDLEAR